MGYGMGYIRQNYGIYFTKMRGILGKTMECLWDIIGNIFKLKDILRKKQGIH